MKRYENEVLMFDLFDKNDVENMRKTLCRWGLLGFELVSVMRGDVHSRSAIAFLRRELIIDTNSDTELAELVLSNV